MPIFRADNKLIYYAHVPKCGGSSVAEYLTGRLGRRGLYDSLHDSRDPATSWSRTSPQHIDRVSLSRLFPLAFFDAIFTIVRNPVARAVSAYHFQLEVEQKIAPGTTFLDWLKGVEATLAEDPFVYDNHVRPMNDVVPLPAVVFHMEHGLDALIPWLDAVLGRQDGEREIPRINERGVRGTQSERVRPGDRDLELIARIYAPDFDRFGYRINAIAPLKSAPTAAEVQAMARQRPQPASPLRQFGRRVGRKLRLRP